MNIRVNPAIVIQSRSNPPSEFSHAGKAQGYPVALLIGRQSVDRLLTDPRLPECFCS